MMDCWHAGEEPEYMTFEELGISVAPIEVDEEWQCCGIFYDLAALGVGCL
jgi:hypothetical protein